MSLVQTRDKVNKDLGREGGDDTMKTLLLVLHSVCVVVWVAMAERRGGCGLA